MSTSCQQCAKHAHTALAAMRALGALRDQIKVLDARVEDIISRLDTKAVNDDAIVEFGGHKHRFMDGTGWVRI